MSGQKSYDVLVVGGGVAGVAAALECARGGLTTALVEKTVLFGGMATIALVPYYVPLCDGQGRQVTFGIAEELLKSAIKYGPGSIPPGWPGSGETGGGDIEDLYPEARLRRRFMARFQPAAFALALDELLEASGAQLWLDTLACLPLVESGKVVGVEVENKSGRIAIRAGCVIDATGDADVAARAGAPCEQLGSFPSYLYQVASREPPDRPITRHRGAAANEMSKGYEGDTPRLSAVRGREVSAFLMESRRIAREKLAAEQAALGPDGRMQLYPAALPAMHQIRMSRMIRGLETVAAGKVNQRCDSSVGLIADCRKVGAVWEVPYGSLLPDGVGNLLAVGRCASAQGYAWQVTRLIPAAALTGQVAGVAAILAVNGDASPDRLAAGDVQKAVEARGILLHL